jgi:hypothetical protein
MWRKPRHIGLERLVRGFLGLGQERAQGLHPVTAQAAVQPGTRDFGIEELASHDQKVIEGQEESLAQAHDNGLLGRGERGLQPVGGVGAVVKVGTQLPLAHRRFRDVVSAGQHRHRFMACGNLRPHRRRGARLFMQGNHHGVFSPRLFWRSSSIKPLKTSRAKNNGYRFLSI